MISLLNVILKNFFFKKSKVVWIKYRIIEQLANKSTVAPLKEKHWLIFELTQKPFSATLSSSSLVYEEMRKRRLNPRNEKLGENCILCSPHVWSNVCVNIPPNLWLHRPDSTSCYVLKFAGIFKRKFVFVIDWFFKLFLFCVKKKS
jgi:hypothetical protein